MALPPSATFQSGSTANRAYLLNTHFLRLMGSLPVNREEGTKSRRAGLNTRGRLKFRHNLFRQAVVTHSDPDPGSHRKQSLLHCPDGRDLRSFFSQEPRGMVTDGIVPYLPWTDGGYG